MTLRANTDSTTAWRALLVLGILVTLLAAWSARRLTVVHQLKDLLPEEAPAAEDYRRYLATFGGATTIYVLVTSPDEQVQTEMLVEAADLVAGHLNRSEAFAWARSGVDEVDEHFLFDYLLPLAPVLTSLPATEVEARLEAGTIRRRVREIRDRLLLPLAPVEKRFLVADPLGLLEDGLQLGTSLVDPATGGFTSESGTVALVVAVPRADELDAAAGRELARELDATFARVRDQLEVEFDFGTLGGPLYAAGDEALIRRDLTRSFVGAAIGVLALLLAFFRLWRVPVAIFVSTLIGVLWTAGLAAALLDGVSIIALSFASILVGLGVDHGMHAGSAFLSERAGGAGASEALAAAIRRTGYPILISAATTAGAFLVLSSANYAPVRELGVLAGAGIPMVLLAALCLGGPLLLLSDRRRSGAPSLAGLHRLFRSLVEGCLGLARRAPAPVLAGAALLAILGVSGLGRVTFSADLDRLRSEDHPSHGLEQRLVESFAIVPDASQVVLSGPDRSDVLRRAERLATRLRAEIPEGLRVSSPSDWLLPDGSQGAEERAIPPPLAARAAATLREELGAAGLDPAAFSHALAVIDALAQEVELPAPPPDALPVWVERQLVDRNGTSFAALELSPTRGSWDGGPPEPLVRIVESLEPHAWIASFPRVAAELRTTAAAELGELKWWSLLVLFALVILSTRGRLGASLMILLPAVLGFLVTLGTCGWLGIELDLLSAGLAPLILGIGLDDGLHAVHGGGSGEGIRSSLRLSGPAMTMTTLTTSVGFGGLLFTHIPALRAAGAVVTAGTMSCLLITLLVLPALAELSNRRGRQS